MKRYNHINFLKFPGNFNLFVRVFDVIHFQKCSDVSAIGLNLKSGVNKLI